MRGMEMSAWPDEDPCDEVEQRRIRFGLIGLGYWGRNYLRLIEAHPECELAVVCDTSRAARGEALTAATGARATNDVFDAISDPVVDAVVIATPATTHFSIASAALSAGKHVLCEKPLTLIAAESEELIALAEDLGKTLFVGHTFIYNPAVRAVRSLVQDGELGSRLHGHAIWAAPGPVRGDVSALWDLSPHPISILTYVLGSGPTSVTATGQAILDPDREDIAFLHLEFGDFATADVHVSWLGRVKTRMLTLTGDRRVAIFDDMAQEAKLRVFETSAATGGSQSERIERVPEQPIHVPELSVVEPLGAQLHHFLECCHSRTRHQSSGMTGHCVVATLEAAQESLLSGGAVSIGETQLLA
jgi:predicted dehydrogenase